MNRAFRIDPNCVEAHEYHYLYLICKEGNYSDVSHLRIAHTIDAVVKQAQQAFTQMVQAMDIAEPKGAWHYYEMSQVIARVVCEGVYPIEADRSRRMPFQCGRNPQILQHSETLLQRALDIDATNTDYLIEGGFQALMACKFSEANKFYKSAAKMQSDNLAAMNGKRVDSLGRVEH